MRQRGSTTLIIIISVVLILLGAIAAPTLLLGYSLGGKINKFTGAFGPGGSGCYVNDAAFTDTSIIAKQDEVIKKITEKWANAKTNERYLKEVFTRGQKEGINPLIPLAIWAGEQSFGNPDEAFGYGNTDSGPLVGTSGWDAELDGVYSRIRKTLNNEDPYNKPVDGNRFTRLFFSYTTAMRYVYETNGNTWNEDGRYTDGSQPVKARLAVFRLVAEGQITCQTSTLVAGARSGNDGVPLYKQGDYPQPYGTSTIAASGCCTVSATMILNYYGIGVDPVTISNLSFANSFYVTDKDTGKSLGTNHFKFYPFLAGQYGLSFTDLGVDWNTALNHLKNRRPIIARGEGGEPYTKSGHCIVLTGYDEETGLVRVNNPASGDGPYSLNQLKNQTTVLYLLTR